jgi:hypothetical protein
MHTKPLNRKLEAERLQAQIEHNECSIAKAYLGLGAMYRKMHTHHFYIELGFETWEAFMESRDLSRSRIEDLIYVYTQLEGSYCHRDIIQIRFDNGKLLVRAFGPDVPKPLRKDLLIAAKKLAKLAFHKFLNEKRPNLHLPVEHPKTIVFDSKEARGKLAHAINVLKQNGEAETEAQAVEVMAEHEIARDIGQLPAGPLVALARQIRAAEVDRLHRRDDRPTAEQWANVVTSLDALMSTLVAAAEIQDDQRPMQEAGAA